MDIFRWIDHELKPRSCNSVELFYDKMDSQSGYSLPLIYQPFDATNKYHWMDRGSLFDYLFSVNGENKRLLDFGPGDGWPSLIVAPFAKEIVGIDGSRRRVSVCTDNARRMGISNVRFVYVEPGSHLPFEDSSFDGIMAASSVEQTPNPKDALQEFYRVLKPGGCLRISYEDLVQYRNSQEQEAHLVRVDEQTCSLILYNRYIDEEYAKMYRITFTQSREDIVELLGCEKNTLTINLITTDLLDKLRTYITEERYCLLNHPSGKTFVSWMKEIGFREMFATHSGGWFAGQLFDKFSSEERPVDIDSIDALLQPIVRVVVRMAAALETNPMITAVK